MKLLFITKDLADNSTGRTYSLWLLASHLGWDASIVAPRGEHVWPPVRTPEFTAACSVLSASDDRLHELAEEADLIVAVKALPPSLGLAEKLATRHSKPLIVDIDDPDIEATLSTDAPLKAAAKMLVRPKEYWPTLLLSRRVTRYPALVSNPVLQSTYGGAVVPHVRADSGLGPFADTANPTIAFVGTNRPHKGVEVLREAARTVQGGALPLIITDAAPATASPNERWVGSTSLAEGIKLVKSSEIVVIPSVPSNPYAGAQLPVKIVDAMLAGRAVVVSDLAPLTWAVGEAGRVVPAGDSHALAKALAELRDPALRRSLGLSARERALSMFTVDSAAEVFRSACEAAVEDCAT